MFHRKFKIVFLLCLIAFHSVFSQEGYNPYSSTTCPTCKSDGSSPVPPIASSADYATYDLPASLGSYGKTEVEMYSGLPSIGIPFYTVQAHGFSLPISLSYNASGIKVTQEADWTGLGWSLSAGNPITRVVRGGDDFVSSASALDNPNSYSVSSGGLNPQYFGPDNCIIHCANSAGTYLESYVNNEKDLQTDIFYFNVPGYSGKFILEPTRNQNRQVFLLKKEKIKITLTYTTNVQVPSIQITTPDGTNYYYGEVSGGTYSTSTYIQSSRSYTDVVTNNSIKHLDNGSTTPESATIATAWNLRQIVTPSNEVITFSYYPALLYTSPTIQSQINVYNALSDLQNATANKQALVDNYGIYEKRRISQITFPLGKVIFSASSQRSDLTGDYLLSGISVYNNLSQTDFVKKYQFYYDYFNNALTYNTAAKDYLRLKLTKVVEVDAKSNNEMPGYSFTYNESVNCGSYASITLSLPSKKSMGIDHWGFFNNKNAGETILKPTKEQVTVYVNNIGYQCNFSNGLDRDIDVSYLQAGILTKLSYPTGGFTQYTYEPHDYYSPSNFKKVVGGLRVNQIKVSDGVSGKDMYTVYQYLMNDNLYNPTTTSSGVLMQDIMYTKSIAGSGGWPAFRSGNNTFPVGTHSDANVVGYSEVTVLTGLNGELGKTINKFYALPNFYYQDYASSFGELYYSHVYNMVQKKSPTYDYETNNLKKYAYVKNGLLKTSMSFRKLGSSYIQSSQTINTYNNDGNIDVPSALLLASNIELIGYLPSTISVCCPTDDCHPSAEFLYTYSCDKVEVLNYLTPYNYKIKLASSVNTVYDQSDVTKFITKSTQYEYANDNHMQLTKVCNDNGDANGAICTEYTYNADYLGMATQYSILKDMASLRYIHNAPVEKIVKRKIGGIYYVIDGAVNTYKYADPSQPATSPVVLDKVYELETNSPLIETTNYNYKDLAGYFINSIYDSPGQFAYDNNYSSLPSVSYSNYDGIGNVQECLNKSNVPASTIWGYSKSYPIAQITNAYRGQATYNGFESGTLLDNDGWILNQGILMDDNANLISSKDVYSGRYSAAIPKSTGSLVYGPLKDLTPSPQTGKYKFSCYIKTNALSAYNCYLVINSMTDSDPALYPNIPAAYQSVQVTNTNGAWVYYEVIIDLDLLKQSVPTGTILTLRAYVYNADQANVVYVDEMKIHPVDAQVTTFTYNPLIGKTSVTNANNVTTFTEYDGLMRIRNIRDHDKNILRRYNYNFKNQ